MPPCTFPIHKKKPFYYKFETNFIYKIHLVINKFFDEYVVNKYDK
jgi:hypothetical protein